DQLPVGVVHLEVPVVAGRGYRLDNDDKGAKCRVGRNNGQFEVVAPGIVRSAAARGSRCWRDRGLASPCDRWVGLGNRPARRRGQVQEPLESDFHALHSSGTIIESQTSIERDCNAVKDSYRSMGLVKCYFGGFCGAPAAREAVNLQLADASWPIGY